MASTVIKINLGHPTQQQSQLRAESARLWRRLVKLHKFCRKRHWKWPTQGQLEKHFKGRFALHSQTIQALVQRFCACIDATRTKRQEGDKSARYPWRDRKRRQIVIWKGQAIKRQGNRLRLPNGQGRKPLILKLPADLPPGRIVQAELGFRELRLTISQELPKVASAGDNVMAGDLGVIHLNALTDGKDALILAGRGLRSLVQYRNKQLAQLGRLLSRCKKGSRRHRKLRVTRARMLTRNDNQIRNFLHHAANQTIDYCIEREAGQLCLGDCFDMTRHAKKRKKGSRRSNQMNAGNPLGQYETYLKYKGARRGVTVERQEESYTTQTCPKCHTRHKPAGRVYKCKNPRCDFVGVRDLVGSANILNKALNGGKMVKGAVMPPDGANYRRPGRLPVIRQGGVVGLTGRKSLDTTPRMVGAAEAADSKELTRLTAVA